MRSAAPALLGAVAVAGLGLHALPGEPDLARPALVVVPAPARATATAPERSAPPVFRIAVAAPATEVTGRLDDMGARALHERLGWDGAADPGIWATPATFSAVD